MQLQDRRSGERVDIVAVEQPVLDRHEIDELYGALLESCLACDAVVVTGAPDVVPDDFYTRLVTDSTAHDIPVFADVHGSSLEATLAEARSPH